jgi:hypothetical protein
MANSFSRITGCLFPVWMVLESCKGQLQIFYGRKQRLIKCAPNSNLAGVGVTIGKL